MPELMIGIVIMGSLAAIAAPSIPLRTHELEDTAVRVTSHLRMIRTKAVARQSAYRLRPTSSTQFIVERAYSCGATTWQRDPGFADEDLQLDQSIQLTDATVNSASVVPPTNWSLCYTHQGLADRNLAVTLSDEKSNQQQIEVFPGGTIEVRPQ